MCIIVLNWLKVSTWLRQPKRVTDSFGIYIIYNRYGGGEIEKIGPSTCECSFPFIASMQMKTSRVYDGGWLPPQSGILNDKFFSDPIGTSPMYQGYTRRGAAAEAAATDQEGPRPASFATYPDIDEPDSGGAYANWYVSCLKCLVLYVLFVALRCNSFGVALASWFVLHFIGPSVTSYKPFYRHFSQAF